MPRLFRAVFLRLPLGLQPQARAAAEGLLGACASAWRRCLNRTLIIGITGSVGKTTATSLLDRLLLTHGSTTRLKPFSNGTLYVPANVLRIRPWHRFAVVEAGTWTKGDLRWMGKIVRPRIAAILAVSKEHYAAFRTLSAVAIEKQSFLDGMGPGGIVWLNGDDPEVARMQAPSGVRVRWFGSSPDFDIWADNVAGAWPDRLSFDVHFAGQVQPITTRLVGTHWLGSALGAIGIALDCGMTLPRIAAGLARTEPLMGRLQPVSVSTGATLLRDELKSSPTSCAAALQVMREARGVRRWFVFGGMDDTPLGPKERMTLMGREIAEVAEFAIFLGNHAEAGVRRAVAAGMPAERVFHAPDLQRAAHILREHSRSGDLILLKGPVKAHLTRIYFALEEDRFGPVTCWKSTCNLKSPCDLCPQLHGSRP